MYTVKELKEALEDYGDHIPVILYTVDGQREIGSVEITTIQLEDAESEFNGDTGVALYTID